jgi:signal transduction histidine kinase
VVALTVVVSVTLFAIIFLAHSDRKRAVVLAEKTRELITEQTKLQASINSLNVGFIVTDTNFNIVNINSTAKLLLCVAERAKNTKPGILVDPLGINQECTIGDIHEQLKTTFNFQENLERCLKERRLIDVGEVEFRNLFLRIFMSPIVMFEEEKLNVLGTVIVVEDTTQKTVLERAKDEFFSIASHELRTPLTSIRGNTSLIKDYYKKTLSGDKNLNEMVNDIHQSSVRLIEIVNDFLDTSRLQQGRMIFTKVNFNFSEVANEVVKELSSIAKERKLYLKLEQEKNLPEVVGDRDRLKQVLINLVGNALKFTDKGGVTVEVKKYDQTLKIIVTDSGRGIEPKNQKLLFKKFQQAGSSLYTRDTTKGTGLGLYISKLIVEAMGGIITLEKSEPNKETVFSFTIPFAEEKKA